MASQVLADGSDASLDLVTSSGGNAGSVPADNYL